MPIIAMAAPDREIFCFPSSAKQTGWVKDPFKWFKNPLVVQAKKVPTFEITEPTMRSSVRLAAAEVLAWEACHRWTIVSRSCTVGLWSAGCPGLQRFPRATNCINCQAVMRSGASSAATADRMPPGDNSCPLGNASARMRRSQASSTWGKSITMRASRLDQEVRSSLNCQREACKHSERASLACFLVAAGADAFATLLDLFFEADAAVTILLLPQNSSHGFEQGSAATDGPGVCSKGISWDSPGKVQ